MAGPLAADGLSWTVPLLDCERCTLELEHDAGLTTSAAFVIDSTLPVVTLTGPDAGALVPLGAARPLLWQATDARLKAMPVELEVSFDGGWSSLASSQSAAGRFDFTPTTEGSLVRVRARATDLAGNVGVAVSEPFTVDGSPPVFTPGSFRIDGNGTSTTRFVTVRLEVRDDASPVTAVCLKYDDRSAPDPADACWVSMSPSALLQLVTPFRLGFPQGRYQVFGWARNAAGLVSTLTDTPGTDTASVDFAPVPPPDLSFVVAGSTPSGTGTTFGPGSTVYVRWRAQSPTAFTLSVYTTTDDSSFTQVVAGLSNAPGAGCQVSGLETGCLALPAPTTGYFRVRLGASDVNGRSSFRSTPPLNVGSTLRVLAGSLDPGTSGSAEVAVFATQNQTSSFTFPGNLVVTAAGTVYFNDVQRGLLEVSPLDGVQRLAVPRLTPFDGGFGLSQPVRIALDAQERVLIYDANLIRRYDPQTKTLETLIGGGTSTATTVAPRALQLPTANPNTSILLLFGTPDGRLWFQTDEVAPFTAPRLRVYDPADGGLVRTLPLVGNGDGLDAGQDLSVCQGWHLGATFDPVTGALDTVLAAVRHNLVPECPSPPSRLYYLARFDGAGRNAGQHPALFDEYTGYSVGANGALYGMNRRTNVITRYAGPDAGPTQFTVIAGTGRNGSCPDGTLATACDLDVSDVYASRTGQVYFFDRGRVRTLDQSNRVYTLMGVPMFAGDGVDAREARIGVPFDVKAWRDGGTDVVVFYDATQFRFREFPVGGVMRTIAGNGTEGQPSTTLPADTQSISYNQNGTINEVFFQVHPTRGDVYTNRGPQYLSRLDRQTNRWVDLIGGGSVPYYLAAAENAPGATVDFTGSYSPKVIGFDGVDTLMFFKWRYASFRGEDAFLKLVSLTPPHPMRTLAGSVGTGATTLPGAGAAVTSQLPFTTAGASWDGIGNRWVVFSPSEPQVVRALPEGGPWAALMTSTFSLSSVVARRTTLQHRLYGCRSTTGQLVELDVTTNSQRVLPWPIPRLRCVGKSLALSPAGDSLLVPVMQDGAGAILQYVLP